MPCKFRLSQISTVNGALRAMGISRTGLQLPAFRELTNLRSALISEILPSTPRTAMAILRLVGLSPGSVRVWLDTEYGWMAEGRKTPGDPPVYHHITEAEAIRLMSKPPDAELAHRLMEPDSYAGE